MIPSATRQSARSRSYSRLVLPAVLAAYGLIFACVWVFGWRETWQRLLGDPMTPPFADLRIVTGVPTTLAQGLDPFVAHPGDVWNRAFNYPRVWIAIAAFTGLGPAQTNMAGAIVLACFFAGVAFTARLAVASSDAWLLFAATLTPSLFLAVSRGNVDLIIFAIVAAAIAMPRRPWASAAALGCAAVLKLFPAFGLAALAQRGRNGVRAAMVAAALLVAYIVTIRSDIPLLHANTQRTWELSYGLPSMAAWLSYRFGRDVPPGWATAVAAVVTAASVLIGFAVTRRLRYSGESSQAYGATVAAFIFVGSFCSSSNFDYRLVFLIPAIPFLNAMRRSAAAGVERIGWIGLVALAVHLWTPAVHFRSPRVGVLLGTGAGLVLVSVFTGVIALCLMAHVAEFAAVHQTRMAHARR